MKTLILAVTLLLLNSINVEESEAASLQFTGSSSSLNVKPVLNDGTALEQEQELKHRQHEEPESEVLLLEPRTIGTVINIITFIPRTILRFINALYQIVLLTIQTAINAKMFAVRLVSIVLGNFGIYLRRVFNILLDVIIK